ncbi:MAG TPA: hypothetical protein VK053_22945 [Jiangellaceae bacterium]|nr:hypothetical protein [Jiangellaceae bacterium]
MRTRESLLVDRFLPTFDVALTEHLVIGVEAERAFAAMVDFDFMTVKTPVLQAALFVRGIPSFLARRDRDPVPELRLSQGTDLPGWGLFGIEPGRELAFGAIGRFWQADITWGEVDPDTFADFNEPGWGKIGCALYVRPGDRERSCISYECRTATTDPDSRRMFARYWTLIRPFVRHILRATLRTIGEQAKARAG